MTFVVWKTAEKREDTRALQGFTCALKQPPRGREYSWELEVQKYFRKAVWADTSESRHLDQRFRIAIDGEGVAAAYTHARLADQPAQFVVHADEQSRLLVMLGVAVRYRHEGGKFADEVLLDALYDILESEPYSANVNVLAKVHMRNIPSQRMLTRAGFQQHTTGTSTRPLGWWSLTLER
ncbi:hypothetical protein AB0D60_35135 [Streptomyces sp. NPDC048306]|uniref:hypothetical protein n=1 Tax=Streptomyces sp. NPDC048306 TaxID=3154502 RepID=UPI0033CC260D